MALVDLINSFKTNSSRRSITASIVGLSDVVSGLYDAVTGLLTSPNIIRQLTPHPSGDSGPMINAALDAMKDTGGVVYLSAGDFYTNQTINVPSKCAIIGAGSGTTQIIKGASWTANATLINMAGAGTGATIDGYKVSMMLQDLTLWSGTNFSVGTGLILDMSYAAVSALTRIKIRGNPTTAIMMRGTWDSTFTDVHVRNSGGVGATNACIKILGTSNDKANVLRFYGLWVESFPDCAVYVTDDGFGSNSGPYSILFSGTKFESVQIKTDNATFFKSDAATSAITINDLYTYAGNVINGSTPRTGFRFIDIDGSMHTVRDVKAGHDTNISVTSVVRLPRSSAGGSVSEVRLAGNDATKVTCIVEVDAVNAAGNTLSYPGDTMRVSGIKPYGAVPLLGGTGAETVRVRMPQLEGSPTFASPHTAGRTIRRGEVNRIIEFNHASTNASFTVDIENATRLGEVGDSITVAQLGAATATLVPWSGVTIQVPTGKSLTTNGQYTEVKIRKVAINTWRAV